MAIDTKKRPESDPKLRKVVEILGLSEVWVRRQLRKGLDTLLGQHGYKDGEGHWRVPAAVVAEVKRQLEVKWERYDARARGELKDASHQYVPDRVKAPQVIQTILEQNTYGLNADEKATVVKLLDAIEAAETKAWRERASQRVARKS